MSEGSSEAIFWEGPGKELSRYPEFQRLRRVTSIPGVIRCHAVSELAKIRVMAKGEVPSPPEQEGEEECLHCAIVALVEARIAAGGADATDLAALIVESLVDLILRVPEEEQAQLLAHTLSALGDLFLQKSGLVGEGSGSTH